MILTSIVLTELAAMNDKQRWQACKAVAREYPAYGIFHSHQTTAAGGKAAPHVHLFTMVPGERIQLWMEGAKADLARRFANTIVELSEQSTWIVNPRQPANLLRYAIGGNRKHTPLPVYWTRSHRYIPEQRSLDALLTEAHRPTARGSFLRMPAEGSQP